MRCRSALLAVGAILPTLGTVLAFPAFDGRAHSASDTLRPLPITTAPVRIVATASARVLLRDG